MKVGHFTQLVWDNTKYVGVGTALNVKTGRICIVARYSPPGNVYVPYWYADHVHGQKHKGI